MILITSPTPRSNATLLASAAQALREGLEVASAVIARTALEAHLRSLCIAHDCLPHGDRAGASQYLSRLYQRRHLTRSTHRELKQAIDVGNRACHGEAVAWHEVSWLLGVVKTTMMSHPLPVWFEDLAATG